jgi:hypothetical protein
VDAFDFFVASVACWKRIYEDSERPEACRDFLNALGTLRMSDSA